MYVIVILSRIRSDQEHKNVKSCYSMGFGLKEQKFQKETVQIISIFCTCFS